jgi:type II secretory pathway pseudopilin PulG
MSLSRRTRRGGRRAESGHLLLIVMIGLTVMAIMLAAAVQQWSTIQRRESEKELIFRGNQYVKAIRLYQKEHGGALPTSLESLAEPGPRGLRYIRKLFRDPMTPPQGKWGILLADPSGKGYINPNAPPPAEEGVEGLEDLGRGLRQSKLEAALSMSSKRNAMKEKVFGESGGSIFAGGPARDSEDLDDKSVTAPGQPVGPIVGVVSLADFSSSYRIYRNHESYGEWAFNIFETGDGQNAQQQPLAPVATPGSGIGPGGSQMILGGADGAVGGSSPNIGFQGGGKPKK